MKTRPTAVLALTVLVLALANLARSQETAPPRIAWVDFNRAIEESSAGKTATQRLRDSAKEMQAKVDQERKEIRAAQEKLNEERGTLTPQEIEERLRDMQQRAARLQERFGAMQKQLENEEVLATSELTKKMKALSGELAKERGLSYVLNSTAVVVGDPAGDLTSELVKKLDAK